MDLPVELYPDVDFPFVIVQTVYPGASAESIETDVTKPIEDEVNQIAGIRHITAWSREGYSLIFIEFELETEGAVATQDVREKVAGIRSDLPDDIEEPVVSQYNHDAEAIMSITVSGRRPAKDITQLVKDQIIPRIESIAGVGTVNLIGGHDREVLISLNPQSMEAKQITVEDVTLAVQSANMDIPGGRIDEADQEFLVRVKGRLDRVEQFNHIIVKNRKGTPIFLSDVATVSDTIAEQRSLARLNGTPAVTMSVLKQSGANVVALARDVRAELNNMRAELPPDLQMTIVNDNSVWIEDSIAEILNNIQFGTLLAVIVIFLFLLDVRPTIITGLSIPISIVATFTAMKFLGFSINMMTLLGLSLAVGILIDDSIVVVENIYRRIQEGESPLQAAFTGTDEIGLAVAATTFSIMVVFLPVAFMEGIVGRFFYQFGMTVSIAVLVSLFVAFTLVPMLASRPKLRLKLLIPAADKSKRLWPFFERILGVWNKLFNGIRPIYDVLLKTAMRHRILTMAIATAVFIFSLFLGSTIPAEWMTETDQGKVWVSISTPPGSSLDVTSARAGELEAKVKALPEVDGQFLTIGGGNNEVTDGSLLVLLKDKKERTRSAAQLVPIVRDIAHAVPGMKTSVQTEPTEGGSSKPIEFSIRGEDRNELARIAHRVQDIFEKNPGTADVDNTLEEGKPEMQIDVDRRLADDLGVNLYNLSSTVRTLIEGDKVTRYKEGDNEYDVRVRLDARYRASTADIGRILIGSEKEIDGINKLLIPISRVADLESKTSIGEYARFDRRPEVRVNANPALGAASGTVSQELVAQVDSLVQLSPGYTVAPVGMEEIRGESNQNMLIALFLAVMFIYITLASQYGSFFDPLSIMLSLPLSLIGAFLALKAFGSTMNIMTNIGIVMLMGLVTKNAILLIDFVKQRREQGVDRLAAIVGAGQTRFRPILMTAMATVFGMLPLALGLGEGAELRAPMARAVIGGMISSTVLTLVVVPVVYSLIDDSVEWFKRLFVTSEIKPEDGVSFAEAIDTPQQESGIH
jgi:HAE1 family hydrophobic/amphiphilic exporter-1